MEGTDEEALVSWVIFFISSARACVCGWYNHPREDAIEERGQRTHTHTHTISHVALPLPTLAVGRGGVSVPPSLGFAFNASCARVGLPTMACTRPASALPGSTQH